MDAEPDSDGQLGQGLQPAVFFDLDRTIIEGSSISQFGMAAWRAGLINPAKMGTQLIRGLLFDWIGESEGVADETLPKILETIKGKKRSEMLELQGPLVKKMLAEARPETLRLLGFHARMGRDCYVISASAIEIVGRLAEELGFTGAIATEAEVVDGVYTGRLVQPFRHGQEKARAIARLAEENNYDLSLSFAYGDSFHDLPMLELVGIPIAINPDSKLADVAYERGWPVVQFAKPHHVAARRFKVGFGLGAAFAAGVAAKRSWDRTVGRWLP
ncbi:MAG: HAD family hydrolase [bacterium]|nr:HAD family hydrolase [bacterium]